MKETLKYRFRAGAREWIWGLKDLVTRPSVHRRRLPDYLVIGAQRCGTTSLQNLLASHPDVSPPRWRKGIHYFDTAYTRGSDWYRSQFPIDRPGIITGEGSPYYLFHPLAPDRIAELVPGVKLIALLRDPVERAISHYKHEVRRGFETLAIEAAMAAEAQRLKGEEGKMKTDPSYYSFAHQHFSYQARGLYSEQLNRYASRFPRQNILALQSEEFWESPQRIFQELLRFLNLVDWEPPEFPRLNATRDVGVSDSIRSMLSDEFAEPNATLRNQWNVGQGWQ